MTRRRDKPHGLPFFLIYFIKNLILTNFAALSFRPEDVDASAEGGNMEAFARYVLINK
jgi:hypothetical protein